MKGKLVVTYFSIILVTFLFISFYMLHILSEYTFQKRSVELLTVANIVSSFTSENSFVESPEQAEPLFEMLNIAEDSRVIILDKDAKVLYDTSKTANLTGKTMAEEQIINALSGNSTSKKIKYDDSYYIGIAVPVTKNAVNVGAVYLQSPSGDLDDIYDHFKRTLIVLGVVVCLFAIVVTMVMANVFTAPIAFLTTTITKISETDSRRPVNISGSREINQLVSAFNSMLEKINDLDNRRQEFVSNASHELKTPLSSIKLICDSLVQNPDVDRETVHEFLGDMNNEVDRLTRITNKLLSLTKIDTSLTESDLMEFKITNLKSLAGAVLKSLQPLAEQKNITLTACLAEDVFALVDADKIWEALYNIVDNSIKYTPRGGKVYVEMYRSEGKININIMDNGIGIAPEEKDKIFDRFYRVDKARARETGGTGLGLSIAMSSITLHGGTIEVESRENEGSLFKIVLPGSPQAPTIEDV